jgi:hypothetical protein
MRGVTVHEFLRMRGNKIPAQPGAATANNVRETLADATVVDLHEMKLTLARMSPLLLNLDFAISPCSKNQSRTKTYDAIKAPLAK